MNNILNTQLIYNSVSLPFVKTEEFRQEPFFSPDGVDLLGLHFTITVSGFLHSCFLGMDPAQWIEQSRLNLLQRGGQLYMYMGSVEIFPSVPNSSPPPTTGRELVASPIYNNPDNYTAGKRPVNYISPVAQDVRLGPRPVRFDVRKISGGSYAFVYTIETWVAYCFDNSVPAALLSVQKRVSR